MKEHTEPHLDKLSKKVMSSTSLESPSADFTKLIMQEVESLPVSRSLVYKPLISKTAWAFIVIAIAGIIGFVMYSNLEPAWSDKIDLSILSNNKLSNLISGITISKTVAYAIGFFGLMWFIQIPLLKRQLDRRLKM